jgi:hypothetical protein
MDAAIQGQTPAMAAGIKDDTLPPRSRLNQAALLELLLFVILAGLHLLCR